MPLVAGWVSDRIGRRIPIVVVYLGGAVGFVALVLAGENVAAIWVAILVIGAFTFAESPQLQALLADTTPSALRDVSYAVFFTTTFVATSLWTILYGAIIGALGEDAGLPVVFWLMAGAFVMAAVAIFGVRIPGRGHEAEA
jgi:MFS family permease